ncbi:MAG: hypothetical protein R3F59_15835 [Myxococcota bacterium]
MERSRWSGLWLPLLAGGCVLSVDESLTIHDPVDRIEIEVSAGDVSIRGVDGPVKLSGNFGGAGKEPEHSVSDGVLTVSYDCGLCGGRLTVDAPPETAVVVTTGAGDVSVDGMLARLDASLSGGSADVRDHGAGPVIVTADIGDVDASFVEPPDRVDVDVTTGFVEIEVPPEAYALDLRAPAGSTSVQGITDDPSSPFEITARTRAGSISVRGR